MELTTGMKRLQHRSTLGGRLIYLVGFMASGKTSVGRMLAERLSVPFLDSDDLVELMARLDIPQIFEKRGEEAFRDIERKALHRVSALRNVVVATGGGAVLSGRNRALMRRTGVVVWLDVPLEEAVRRIEGSLRGAESRPLLGRAKDLYPPRIPLYSSVAHLRVDTAGKSPGAVCDEIIRGIASLPRTARSRDGDPKVILNVSDPYATDPSCTRKPRDASPADAVPAGRQTTVTVTPGGDNGRSYEVLVGAGVLERVPSVLAALRETGVSGTRPPGDMPASRLVLFSDPLVYCLYGRRLEERLQSEGFSVLRFLFPGDEASKNMRTVEEAYDFLAENGVTRDTGLLSLGGGVVGDLAGFVAATYMRGIPFIQVPTTLLAQIDASVGGKVAVDHPLAKNLIGTFYHPLSVIADVKTLCSLPDSEYRQGLAEMVKYAVIEGEDMMGAIEGASEDILRREPLTLTRLILRCVAIKARIVSADERDRGTRQFLNLGHTLGHALEAVTGYRKGDGGLSHGDAVAMGLHWACRISEKSGLAEEGLSARVKNLLERLGLPTRLDALAVDRDAVLSAMRLDKKARSGRIQLVLPRRPGHIEIQDLYDIPEGTLNEELDRVLAGKETGRMGRDEWRKTTV